METPKYKVLIKMGVISTSLIAFLFCGIILGEEVQRNETACPPTIVDCACTEKDGNFYTIQINTTTVYVSDEDTGMDRCVVDGDPLALCEDRDCVIIPNDNFATLFRKGRKMSPSNYLEEDDLEIGNETSTGIASNRDEMAGPELWDELTAPFYPIELTYPRMIHGEDSHLLVKRSKDDSDSFISPLEDSFGGKKYRQKDRDSLRSPSGRDSKYRKKGPRPLRHSLDYDFDDEKYRRKDNDSLSYPSDSDYEDEKYRRKDNDSLWGPSDSDYEDEKYRRKDTDSDPDFGNKRYGKKGPGQFRQRSDSDFSDDKYDQDPKNDTDISLSDGNESPSEFSHQEDPDNQQSDEGPTFRGRYANRGRNVNSDPTYWGGNYGYAACKVPQLRNSEVTCWKWPYWQSCKQTCIYGHGIASRKGTLRSTTYSCRNTENQWKPRRMTDCQPYLNCKVRLRTPGDLKCVEPTNRPAYCDIACEEYDNYSAKRVRVTCDENQEGMRLPFCATLDNTVTSYIRSPSS